GGYGKDGRGIPQDGGGGGRVQPSLGRDRFRVGRAVGKPWGSGRAHGRRLQPGQSPLGGLPVGVGFQPVQPFPVAGGGAGGRGGGVPRPDRDLERARHQRQR